MTSEKTTTDQRVSTLRGAGVGEVDVRRLVQVGVGVCLVALAALVVVLYVAGARKNDQINSLHQHGVPVEVTSTTCLGQLGGSGSNAVGYACKGTYTLDGHRYDVAIPGTTLYAPGTKIRVVAVPGHPGLIETPSVLATEQASASVFIVPTILLVVLAALVASLLVIRRRAVGLSSGRKGVAAA